MGALTLHKIGLQGYRCFKRLEWLELKPLTLLYGRNNAGKSTILRALAILERSLSDAAWETGGEDDPGRGALFDDLVWRGGAGLREFTLHLRWSQEDEVFYDKLTIGQDGDQPAYVKRVELAQGSDDTPVKSWRRVPPRMPSQPPSYWPQDDPALAVELRWTGLSPALGQDEALDGLAHRLHSLKGQIQWLHAGRCRVARSFAASSKRPRVLGADGSGAQELLHHEQAIKAQVERFYMHQLVDRVLEVGALTPTLHALTLSPRRPPSLRGIHLADAGEGMSKVLPVVVAVAAATQGSGPSMVLIEDPEAHLHDDATRALAEQLVAMISERRDARVILETHSRTLQMAVRLCIRHKVLNPEDVNLIWASLDEEGHAWLAPVECDAHGLVKGHHLRAAFQQDSELAAALLGIL